MSAKISLKLFILRFVLCLCGIAAVGTIIVLGLVTVFGSPHLSRQVVATTPSPNRHLEAVLTRVSGRAKTGYIVDVNSAAADGDTARVANVPAVSDDSSTPAELNMVWKDDHSLEIHYPHGIATRIEQNDVTVAGQHLTVTLQPQP